jgi:CheY-like chemotaxis protein
MDGYEATLSIRAEEAAHTTPGRYAPILAVTADSCDETLSRCMECGMDGHIEKPVEPSVLFKKMAQVFAVD